MFVLMVSLLPVLVIAGGPSHDSHSHARSHLGPTPKPMSPIRVDIVYPSQAVAGQSFEFDVTVHSAVDANVVNLQIELPDGSNLEAGNLSWSGTLVRDEEKSFNVKVLLPANFSQQVIVASAVIGTFEAPQFSARAIYQASSRTVVHAAASTSNSRTVMRNGRRVVEHTLR